MPHKGVAVVAAMRRELAPLLRGIRPQRADGIEFFELESAVVAVGGIGCKAARSTAEAVVAQYQPVMLVSAGIAGGLRAELKIGDVVRGCEVVDVETGTRYPARGGESVIATAALVSRPAEKRMLADRYNAEVVDMEAAAVAAVAQEHGIEFVAIKGISDELEFVMPAMAQFVEADGKFKTARFAAFVAMRPKWWSAVRQLAANSKLASVNLSEALQHLIREAPSNQEERVPLV